MYGLVNNKNKCIILYLNIYFFKIDGSVYEGEVKASLRYGKGKFVSPNSEAVYEGDWVDGLRSGKGKITF